ncbi:MAG TPA: PhoX family phosphatase [Pseudonocardiaceae bacterium]|nr:PhoX family phosphatase [Pseudonocardiaceae bacterium]
MTTRPVVPLWLHPSRQAVTCRYRCGDACSHEPPNTSGNEYFGAVVARVVSRRGILAALVAAAVIPASGVALTGCATAPRGSGRPLDFRPVAPNTLDAVVVPEGYEHAVVIRWGDPIIPGAPEFDFAAQTPQAQAGQFGYNCDFAALLPVSGDRSLLVVNHEYTTEPFMFLGYDPANPTREQVETSWAAHGLSIVTVARDPASGRLTPLKDPVNRRITATTPMQLTGPAAGSALVQTTADPSGRVVLGTLNNCSGGVTPWGTVLTGEENINMYFGNADSLTDPTAKAKLARYGISGAASGRRWERFDPRFDVSREPNEPHRFGWIVEIDPFDPAFVPRKRTAMGRCKHEAATVRIGGNGTVVSYMGDDERFDYLYKFVSSRPMRPGEPAHNLGILDEGTLYVARFTGDSPGEIDGSGRLPSDGEFDGTGQWIPLARSNADGTGESFVAGMSVPDVLVHTRLAGDAVGATKMDRPEDVEPHPRTGKVYASLTNNNRRGVDGAPADESNPRNVNRHGHVLELTEDGDDPAATTFRWTLLLVCGDPADPATYFAGFPKDQVSPISCPDNLAFDPSGNLWIATDGNALGSNDGLFAVPLDGPFRGQVKQFLTVPRGAETCGPVIEDRLVLVSVQHPGQLDGASAAAPASRWPDGPGTQPRPSVVSIWKTGSNQPSLIGS